MSDFFHPMTEQVSRKIQQCICCGYAIEKGESYCKQSGVWDGSYATNRFHKACWNVLVADAHYGEFEITDGEPPDGARTMKEARAEAGRQQGGA